MLDHVLCCCVVQDGAAITASIPKTSASRAASRHTPRAARILDVSFEPIPSQVFGGVLLAWEPFGLFWLFSR